MTTLAAGILAPVTTISGTMASIRNGINGDPAALLIDRAIGELRRGRAIQLIGSNESLVIAAVETMRTPLLERLASLKGQRALRLVLTAERASALGIAQVAGEPLTVALHEDWDLEQLRTLAGAAPGEPASISRESLEAGRDSMRAALRLAKAGRLVPALVAAQFGYEADDSLLTLPLQSVAPPVSYSRYSLRRTSQASVPLADALDCKIILYRDEHSLGEHVAVIIGAPDRRKAVPVRMHSACLTGDLLGSLRCDCGEQLRTAVSRIAALGGGVLLYLDQEGRGIGLPNKLRAYALQDGGLDTLDADQHLGFLADERNYDLAAAILQELEISRVTLLTNNPQKISALTEHGIEVIDRVPLVAPINTHNERYIRAKRERAGHLAEESGS